MTRKILRALGLIALLAALVAWGYFSSQFGS